MRQTNVCLNRICKFYVNLTYVKFVSRGLTLTFVLPKKCAMKIKRRKQTNKQTKIKNDGRFIQVVTKK